jgi:hypothetical protein
VITRNDVVKLLALAAGADQRTVAEEDVMLWLAIAQQERWLPSCAQRAIIEHYSRGADRPRITPAAITDRLRALRGQAAESFEAPVIPESLSGRDYPAWYRSQLAAHIDLQLDRWANTGQEPDRSLPAPSQNHSLAELVANAPAHVRAELAAGAQRMTRRTTR